MTKQLEDKLIDAGNNKTDVDEALKDLMMSEQEAAELLEVMGREEAEKVLESSEKPLQEMKEQVKEAYEKSQWENPENHTHFEEIDEVDTETGHRKLQFVRHPNKMSMEDHINAIDNRLHRRRLSRNVVPKETLDFESRLSNHIEELHGHVRQLQLACAAGVTAVRCIADELGNLTAALGEVSEGVNRELTPLSRLLSDLSSGQAAMDDAERVARIVFQAVGIATNIPGGIGSIFKLVKNGMHPITQVLKAVDSKATQFENSIGKLWQNSVGRIDNLIDSFDSRAVDYTVSGASAVADIQESVCMTTLINDLSGANLIGGIERSVDVVKRYIELLYSSLKALKTKLESTTWHVVSGILISIVKAVDPVKK